MDPVKKVYVDGRAEQAVPTAAGFKRGSPQRGFDVEFYHRPLDPVGRVEHLIIPELDVAVATSTAHHPYTRAGLAGLIDMDICLVREILSSSKKTAGRLMNCWSGPSIFRRAKETHDQLESHYVPHMDFDGVTALQAKPGHRILSMRRKLPPAC